MKKNVLITGGLGFIGTNFVRYVLKHSDFRIRILDRASAAGRLDSLPKTTRIALVRGDILSRGTVERAVSGTSFVIHMAALTNAATSLVDPMPSITTNVLGTTLLLEACTRHAIERFILLSSSEIYGNANAGIPMDENHPFNPVSPYAASKLAADRIAYAYMQSKKVPVVILRPFNIYGPYQHPEKMIPKFITHLLRDRPIILNHGGTQTRDWIHVDDLVHALYVTLVCPRRIDGEAFNIGTGQATSIKNVAQMILKTLEKPKSLVEISNGSPPETMGNIGISKKARRILGWRPKVTLVTGIRQTCAWYRKNSKWWERYML